MHSVIIRLEQDEHVDLDTSDIPQGFVGSIADYVREMAPGEQTSWLDALFGGKEWCDYDKENHLIIIEDKKKYFETKYEKFMKTLRNMQAITLEDFVGSIHCRDTPPRVDHDYDMWTLNHYYEDKSGVYVICSYYGGWPVPLDRFIRDSREGSVYYLGGLVDYHY